MGDTWIVDITHYGDILDPELDIPGPARRLGEFFGTIVGATTAWPFPDQPRTTGLRCRRRPNRRSICRKGRCLRRRARLFTRARRVGAL